MPFLWTDFIVKYYQINNAWNTTVKHLHQMLLLIWKLHDLFVSTCWYYWTLTNNLKQSAIHRITQYHHDNLEMNWYLSVWIKESLTDRSVVRNGSSFSWRDWTAVLTHWNLLIYDNTVLKGTHGGIWGDWLSAIIRLFHAPELHLFTHHFSLF